MHDGYANALPVRPPTLVRGDLGERGWHRFHELVELSGRRPRMQVLALVRWALWRSLQGDDTNLTPEQWHELLGSIDSLEPVA